MKFYNDIKRDLKELHKRYDFNYYWHNDYCYFTIDKAKSSHSFKRDILKLADIYQIDFYIIEQ